MQLKELHVGAWDVLIGEERVMPREPIPVLENFITNHWRPVIQEEAQYPWLGLTKLGIPSPLIRIDMAPADASNATAKIYEVEIRPSGLYIGLSVLPPCYWQLWKQAFSDIGCEGLVQINGKAQDDFLAANFLGINYHTNLPEGQRYWIRADEQPLRMAELLESKSLTPIRDDGDKYYLVRLGLAKMLDRFDTLDWTKPFVVKPQRGARCEGVEVFLPPNLKKDYIGSARQRRINRTLFDWSHRCFIIQPFIPPQIEELNGQRGWLIWRIYFGWLDNQYKFVGGLWSWRPNVKNHGAKDTICGALI